MRRTDIEVASLSIAEDRPNPFPGLRPFEPDEDHLFFGREKQIDELLRRLRTTRFLAVLGGSGSGKSSLVRSGLIPALYSGYMAEAGTSWRVALMRPGEDPIGNLASALNLPQVLGPEEPQLSDSLAGSFMTAEIRRELMVASLRSSSLGLSRCVREARIPAEDNILVVVDQFEELFRFKRGREERSVDEAVAFVKLLQDAAEQEEVPIYVVLTMRSDFINHCMEFPGLPELINAGMYIVPRMTREERRRAITGPVAVGGATIAARLVTQLLNDVGDDPDQLPILQHALMRTWAHWAVHCTSDEPVDLEDYEAIGTLSEALSRHAEGAYEELADDRLQEVAQRMFKSLTMKDEDNRGIRRPCRLDELCAVAGAEQGEAGRVIEVFRQPGRAFLMPPAGVPLAGDSIIDISHESLMRVWKRLIQWVDGEAEASRFYLRLSRAARRYEEGKGGLWRERELQLAAPWREENQPTEAWGRRYDPDFERAMGFLAESERVYQEFQQRKRAKRAHKLRQARKMAAIYGYAALATLALAVLGWLLWKKAADEVVVVRKDLSVVRGEKQKVEEELEVVKQRVVDSGELERQALAAEELRRQAEERLRNAEEERRRAELRVAEARERIEQARRAAGETESETRRLLAEAEELRRQAEAKAEMARRLRMVSMARTLAVESQNQEPSELGLLMAVQAHRLNREFGGEAQSLEVYNALHRSLEQVSPGSTGVQHAHRQGVRAVAVSPDGSALASGTDDGVLRLVGLDGTSPEVSFDLGSRIRSLAFGAPAADGSLLAAGASDGAIFLVDQRRPGSPPRVLARGGGSIDALAFSPGTRRLAAGSSDGSIRLWNLAAGDRQPTELRPAGEPGASGEVPGRILSLAWNPDGSHLAAASGDQGVWVWDRHLSPAAVTHLRDYPQTRSVAFSRGGRLAVGLLDGRIALWEAGRLDRRHTTIFFGHLTDVNALSFHPAIELLASGSYDGTVRLWDLRHEKAPPIALPDHDYSVWSLTFSPDGERLAVGGGDREVRIWKTGTGLLAEEACRSVARNLTCAEWAEHISPTVAYEKTCPELSGQTTCPAVQSSAP